MNNSIFTNIKGMSAVKVIACLLVVVAITIKIGVLGYEFGQWLKVH